MTIVGLNSRMVLSKPTKLIMVYRLPLMFVQKTSNMYPVDWNSQRCSKDFRVDVSALVGAYNVSNCLAALTAAVYGLGIDPQAVAAGIGTLDGIPCCMEQILLGQNFIAVVDFAHTPNALKVTLEAGRKMSKGRVISVFGSQAKETKRSGA